MPNFVRIGQTLVNADKIITAKEEDVYLDTIKKTKRCVHIVFENGNELAVDLSVTNLDGLEVLLNREKPSGGSDSTASKNLPQTNGVEVGATTSEGEFEQTENNSDRLPHVTTPDWVKNLSKEGKNVTEM